MQIRLHPHPRGLFRRVRRGLLGQHFHDLAVRLAEFLDVISVRPVRPEHGGLDRARGVQEVPGERLP